MAHKKKTKKKEDSFFGKVKSGFNKMALSGALGAKAQEAAKKKKRSGN